MVQKFEMHVIKLYLDCLLILKYFESNINKIIDAEFFLSKIIVAEFELFKTIFPY